MSNDHQHVTADEHVRAAADAALRDHERDLTTAFDHLGPVHVVPRGQTHWGPVITISPPPPIGVSFLDLGVLLICAAALGMVIGGAIVSVGWF